MELHTNTDAARSCALSHNDRAQNKGVREKERKRLLHTEIIRVCTTKFRSSYTDDNNERPFDASAHERTFFRQPTRPATLHLHMCERDAARRGGGALFSYLTGCAKIKKKCICYFFSSFFRSAVSRRAIFLSSDDIKEALDGPGLVYFSYSRPVALSQYAPRERVA
jgi:hypothetical protein